ncbi:MAG: flagellar type III secretion system pore protein FliP [Acidobacteria bacterium]|nr:flagellar type III secretion system pore protein FliP [Acidobacteriota bacterium]
MLLLGGIAVKGHAEPAPQEFWSHRPVHAVAINNARAFANNTPAPVAATPPTAPTRPNTVVSRHSTKPAGQRSIAEEIEAAHSSPWVVALSLTFITLIPAILLAMTPMVRLLVVFHFLRQALGTQTAPSNQILMALSLMMTWFLIQPVVVQVEQQAVAPYRANLISGEEAISRGAAPVKTYMLRYAREKDLALFANAGQIARPQTREQLPMRVVVPAYMISELKAGFQIGAILFLPFMLVDLVVASVTTSVGMMQLPPVVLSTPIKILLFVMVDGWHLLAGSLMKSF